MSGAEIVAPSLLQVFLDFVERSSAVVRVQARDVAQLICGTDVIVPSVGEPVGPLLEALTVVGVVVGRELMSGVSDCASGPPSADCAREIGRASCRERV